MYKHSKEDSGRSLAYHISVLDVSVDASDASGESEMKYYSKLVNQGLYDHEVKFTYQLVFFCDVSVQKKQHDPVIVQNQCGINVLLETYLWSTEFYV